MSTWREDVDELKSKLEEMFPDDDWEYEIDEGSETIRIKNPKWPYGSFELTGEAVKAYGNDRYDDFKIEDIPGYISGEKLF